MNSYRTSIQWSRLIKDREGTINEAGVDGVVEDDYRIEFINCTWRLVPLDMRGIVPLLTLSQAPSPFCFLASRTFV